MFPRYCIKTLTLGLKSNMATFTTRKFKWQNHYNCEKSNILKRACPEVELNFDQICTVFLKKLCDALY